MDEKQPPTAAVAFGNRDNAHLGWMHRRRTQRDARHGDSRSRRWQACGRRASHNRPRQRDLSWTVAQRDRPADCQSTTHGDTHRPTFEMRWL